MTIRSQTFQNKGRSGINTIAAEFRTGSGSTKVLKRTAQNFRITGKNQGDNGNNNNGNNNSNNNNGNSQTNTNTGNRTSSSRDTGSSAGSWSRKMASGAIRIRMEPMRQMSGSSFPTMARWNGTISEQMEP